MSRYNRHQPVISRQNDQSSSEDKWLNNFEKSLQKDAVQSRQQDSSLFDQINSIMNGGTKSKFSSVEAAVEEMKERSGLSAYLDKQSHQQDNSTQKKATASAGDENLFNRMKDLVKAQEWYQLGKLVGQTNKANGQALKAAESIVFFHYYPDAELKATKIPLEYWHTYTLGYGEGAELSDEGKKSDYDFTSKVLNIKNKTASDQNNLMHKKVEMQPIVIKKVPHVLRTIENYIRDTKGNLPVPAIIEKIKSIHSNDCSDPKDWDDDKLVILVSKLNLEAKKNNPDTYTNYSNLGNRDFNMEIDPSNTDAFFGLNPVKI